MRELQEEKLTELYLGSREVPRDSPLHLKAFVRTSPREGKKGEQRPSICHIQNIQMGLEFGILTMKDVSICFSNSQRFHQALNP